jgi:glycosyltransferase involved in cell wall biosynthesis
MKSLFIPAYISRCRAIDPNDSLAKAKIREDYQANLAKGYPEISIVMPAYNEAANIVPTLASLCGNRTGHTVEIIVVNNNSSDNTAELVKACGVRCVNETRQGITHARNAGLLHARGKYILNADADTIYPEDWIEEMARPLVERENVAITYGRFSFIPVGRTGRVMYYCYELLADMTRFYNHYKKTEAVNVYGFNSGFRLDQGLQVEGFSHPAGTNEDGYLALKLSRKGFGKMYRVSASRAIVWTTDRRIQMDGGLGRAIRKRLKRLFNIK